MDNCVTNVCVGEALVKVVSEENVLIQKVQMNLRGREFSGNNHQAAPAFGRPWIPQEGVLNIDAKALE